MWVGPVAVGAATVVWGGLGFAEVAGRGAAKSWVVCRTAPRLAGLRSGSALARRRTGGGFVGGAGIDAGGPDEGVFGGATGDGAGAPAGGTGGVGRATGGGSPSCGGSTGGARFQRPVLVLALVRIGVVTGRSERRRVLILHVTRIRLTWGELPGPTTARLFRQIIGFGDSRLCRRRQQGSQDDRPAAKPGPRVPYRTLAHPLMALAAQRNPLPPAKVLGTVSTEPPGDDDDQRPHGLVRGSAAGKRCAVSSPQAAS